jgi:hypothetical protein
MCLCGERDMIANQSVDDSDQQAAPRTRTSLLMLATCCCLVLCGSAMAADEEADNAAEASDLAKKVQNPLANLVSLPFQFNFNSGVDTGPIAGVDRSGGRRFFNLNIQPVIPFPGKKWNIISRTIIPVNSVPIDNADSIFGLGDTNFSLFWTPAKASSLVWGVGPALVLPTASNPEVLGSEKWSAGPTGVIFYGVGKWTLGAVASNVWSFAGEDSRQDVNFFFGQWFANYNFGQGWALGTAPIITCNWEISSGDQCTVPWGLQVSKVTHFGSRPVNLILGYYVNSKHPTDGAESQARIQVNFMFPQKQK